MLHFHPQFRRNHGFAIALLAIGVSFVAVGAEPTVEVAPAVAPAICAAATPAPATSPVSDAPVADTTNQPTTDSTAKPDIAPSAPENTGNVPVTTQVSSAPAAIATQTVGATSSQAPWRGSAISYGQSVSALTFAPAGQPYYNPTWAQNLTLLPEWPFNDLFFARAHGPLAGVHAL